MKFALVTHSIEPILSNADVHLLTQMGRINAPSFIITNDPAAVWDETTALNLGRTRPVPASSTCHFAVVSCLLNGWCNEMTPRERSDIWIVYLSPTYKQRREDRLLQFLEWLSHLKPEVRSVKTCRPFEVQSKNLVDLSDSVPRVLDSMQGTTNIFEVTNFAVAERFSRDELVASNPSTTAYYCMPE